MLVLGLILIVIGYLVPGLAILSTIGWVLVVVGAILLIVGALGHTVGPRRYYW